MVAAGVCFRRYSDEYNLQQLWSLEGECMCDVVRDACVYAAPICVSCFAGGRQCDS